MRLKLQVLIVLHEKCWYPYVGLADDNPFEPLMNTPKRIMKHLSTKDVYNKRKQISEWLNSQGIEIGTFLRMLHLQLFIDWIAEVFNGGGSGSIKSTVKEPWLTEVLIHRVQ
jgi:hypothetical protein